MLVWIPACAGMTIFFHSKNEYAPEEYRLEMEWMQPLAIYRHRKSFKNPYFYRTRLYFLPFTV
ncbi:MAG: hypothetical protein FWG73_04095 [Planctomycetaceae bacterium]|nr:hypothetical protein [Planctomycetaceae bacterium]